MVATMFFPGSPLVVPADAVTAVGAFWGALGNAMSSACSWSVEREVASIDAVTGDVLDLVDSGVTLAGHGTLTGQPLPPANQALIRWKCSSIVAGRRLQGRTFVPGMTENLSDDGTPNADLVTALETAAAYLLDVTTSGFAVYSHTHHVAAVVTSFSVYPRYAVLRSRRS